MWLFWRLLLFGILDQFKTNSMSIAKAVADDPKIFPSFFLHSLLPSSQCAAGGLPVAPFTGLVNQINGTITTKITAEIQKISFSPNIVAWALRECSK